MSHRDSCPSRWDAEREGRRAFENGYGRWRDPYDGRYRGDEDACPEASQAWLDGYRRAEIRAEEEREEEAARHRAEMRRAELQAEEDYYLQQQYEEQQYEPEQPPNDGIEP